MLPLASLALARIPAKKSEILLARVAWGSVLLTLAGLALASLAVPVACASCSKPLMSFLREQTKSWIGALLLKNDTY